MTPRTDRRAIAPLMKEHLMMFQYGAKPVEYTSDEWHGFMNAISGLEIALDEPNGSAFDKWRQALAAKGYEGIWPYSPARIAKAKTDGEALKAAEEARKAALPVTLAKLADLAPTKTPEQIIADAK